MLSNSVSSTSSLEAPASSSNSARTKDKKRVSTSRGARAMRQARSQASLEQELPIVWSSAEVEQFKIGLAKFAKDFRNIAEWMGTKNHFQCRNFYNNFRYRLHLEPSSSDTTAQQHGRRSVCSVVVQSNHNVHLGSERGTSFLPAFDAYWFGCISCSRLCPIVCR
jgi:hypothetical protein